MNDLVAFARQHNERFARERGWAKAVVEAAEDAGSTPATISVPKNRGIGQSVSADGLTVRLDASPHGLRFSDRLPDDTVEVVLLYRRHNTDIDVVTHDWGKWNRDLPKTWAKEVAIYFNDPNYTCWWLPLPPAPPKDVP